MGRVKDEAGFDNVGNDEHGLGLLRNLRGEGVVAAMYLQSMIGVSIEVIGRWVCVDGFDRSHRPQGGHKLSPRRRCRQT